MAEGENFKWPGPITFNDDDPKKGFFTLFLSAQELLVKKQLFGKSEPKNGTVECDYQTDSICATVKTTNKDGKNTNYQYKKSLPEDIDPAKSSHKIKQGQVILNVCKAKSESWAAHAKYLIRKET